MSWIPHRRRRVPTSARCWSTEARPKKRCRTAGKRFACSRTSAPAHHNLGNALRALDKPVEARAAYLDALRLDPNLAPAHAHLGLVLQQEGQLGDALTWLKQAVELKPEDATYWEYLAELYAEREEQAEAIPCWERVADPRAGTSVAPPVDRLGASGGRPAGRGGRTLSSRRRLKPDFAAAR